MSARIIVVGSLNMDFVVQVGRLPAPGETVAGRDFRMFPGGKGANQACAAARLGGQVALIGRVGNDVFGDRLKAGLAAAGVDVSRVQTTPSEPTGVALIAVERSGQNSIVVAAGANARLAPGEVGGWRALFRGAKVALFQLETPLATVDAALALAREEGVLTILDPAPAAALPRALLEKVDLLTPNESEALALGERPETLGARDVILKLGAKGASWRGTRFPARAVEARDTTGAGDAFNGAVAVALAEERPMPEAIRFANAAAALSVTRLGAQASLPARAEVEKFLAGSASEDRDGVQD